MTADQEIIKYLGGYVSENKKEKIARILEDRTRHISLLLEDLYQPHNASACLRSSECLGIQDIHIIETRNKYNPNNDVALGSAKWLTLHKYHQTSSCLDTLKSRGYHLVATSPEEGGYDLKTLPLDRPVALLFGTEEKGLKPETLAAAESTLKLPMYGFTQSYNISVTVAMALARLVERLRESDIQWKLSEKEKEEITLGYYRRIIKRHDLLEENYWENRVA
ncbi:RNA methyltransferase [Verrucomicrobiales bacterium]|jgi:tRNA (guanosine-2'-O-)-methyltransferase|nr:RNA methyltransferase [Verrucomicrobiales bacterium]